MALWPYLGINYGNDFITGVSGGSDSYSTTRVTNDLTYLYSVGFRKVRIGAGAVTDSTAKANSRSAALIAKSIGFYVMRTYDTTSTLTASNFTSVYGSYVLAEAQWNQDNGIDETQIGNELLLKIDNSSIVYSDLWSVYVKPLATQVKAIFSGVVTYAEVTDFIGAGSPEAWWASNGKGDLDRICFTVYGTPNDSNLTSGARPFSYGLTYLMSNFSSGTETGISEWKHYNSQAYMTSINNQQITGDRLAIIVANRLKAIKNTVGSTFPTYYFTYRWLDNNVNYQFYEIYPDPATYYKPSWDAILQQRRHYTDVLQSARS